MHQRIRHVTATQSSRAFCGTTFSLPGLPAEKTTSITFHIGPDQETNHSDPARFTANHPLNPNLNKLRWDWQGGCIFLALEGHWSAQGEQLPGGTTTIKDGKLDIDGARGCTVWFKQKLTGAVMIEYEATLTKRGGENDRMSDLNCFWMATDPLNPEDLCASKGHHGDFKKFHPLRLYHVGYGANNNTTRFRSYLVGGARPCLPEHDLRDGKLMHIPNKTLKIGIIADGTRIQFLRDGEVVVDFNDRDPPEEDGLGFRTVRNHMRLDNFKVHRLSPGQSRKSVGE